MQSKIAFFLLFLFFATRTNAQRNLFHDQNKHLEDFTHLIISHSERDSIEAISNELMGTTAINVVSVVAKSTQGRDETQFTTELANRWNLRGDNGAILILLVPSQYFWRVEVSTNLQWALPDVLVVRFSQQHLVPNLKAGRFGHGLIEYVSAIAAEIRHDPQKMHELDSLRIKRKQAFKTKKPSGPMIKYVLFTFIFLSGLSYFIIDRTKKKKIRRHDAFVLKQRVDSLINRVDQKIKDAERLKRFEPTLASVIEELSEFRNKSASLQPIEIGSLEGTENELNMKAEAAMIRAELVSNVSFTISGMAKAIVEMQKNVNDARAEYDETLTRFPDLMATLPAFSLDEIFRKQVERIKGLCIDLNNAIDTRDTVKFGPLQGSIMAAQRKFTDAVREHRNAISSIQAKVQYVNSFESKYRCKIEESSIVAQADFISHSSRMSYENLVPLMHSMLERLSKETDFTHRHALCKEIEATYNSAVAGFTREMAARDKKQTNEDGSQEETRTRR